MRKILIIILTVVSMPGFSQGKGDFEFGANIGYNISSLSNTTGAYSGGAGFNIGLSSYYYLSSSWSLEGKLIYDQKGWNNGAVVDDLGNTVRSNFNLNYLTIPVMANYYFGEEENKNWFIEFGPYVGFLLSANENRFDSDVKDFFVQNDYGISVGGGVKIALTKQLKLFFEVEGQTGIAFVFDDGSSMRNNRTGFNTGVIYSLK